MLITEKYHRLKCDNCPDTYGPMAGTVQEARSIATLRGWIVTKSVHLCPECVARLDPAKRQELIVEYHKEEDK